MLRVNLEKFKNAHLGSGKKLKMQMHLRKRSDQLRKRKLLRSLKKKQKLKKRKKRRKEWKKKKKPDWRLKQRNLVRE